MNLRNIFGITHAHLFGRISDADVNNNQSTFESQDFLRKTLKTDNYNSHNFDNVQCKNIFLPCVLYFPEFTINTNDWSSGKQRKSSSAKLTGSKLCTETVSDQYQFHGKERTIFLPNDIVLGNICK